MSVSRANVTLRRRFSEFVAETPFVMHPELADSRIRSFRGQPPGPELFNARGRDSVRRDSFDDMDHTTAIEQSGRRCRSLRGGLAELSDHALEAGGITNRVEIGVGLYVDHVLPAGLEGQAKRLEGEFGITLARAFVSGEAGSSARARGEGGGAGGT